MKPGTQIEIRIDGLDGRPTWASAVVSWCRRADRVSLPEGYWPIRLATGGRVMVHISRLRIVGA